MRGRYFRLPVVLTVLAVASLSVATGYCESGPDLPIKTTVGFLLYRDYLIVVRGSAGPLKGLNFLLDTGTSPSILNPRLVERLHLKPTPAVISVLSDNVQAGTVTVPSLEFGPVRRYNLPVMVQDMSVLEKILPFRVDGIVGLDLLGQSTFVIDYASREIQFGPSPSMPVSVPLQMKEGLAIVDATVNHASVHLVLDTGAATLVLFEGRPDPVTGSKTGGAGPLPKAVGDIERKEIRLTNLSLGEAEFGSERAFMVPNPRDEGHDFDGLISPAALGITRVAVDLTRGTLSFAHSSRRFVLAD